LQSYVMIASIATCCALINLLQNVSGRNDLREVSGQLNESFST